MAPALSSEAWTQIRFDYEHTDIPVEEICAGHGISSGTLRDRMRRWNWTRRRPPVPHEGPPPLPAPLRAPALPVEIPALSTPIVHALEPAARAHEGSPQNEDAGAQRQPDEADDRPIAPRLQSAIARVVPAIEATLARLGAASTPAREMERAARALAALTRTLRELSGLLGQHQAPDTADGDPVPEDIDEFRFELARRIRAFVGTHAGKADGDAGPQSACEPPQSGAR